MLLGASNNIVLPGDCMRAGGRRNTLTLLYTGAGESLSGRDVAPKQGARNQLLSRCSWTK